MIRMAQLAKKAQVEYGDFQTPLELANQVCRKLVSLNLCPDIIIEPTCGIGNFIQAAASSFQSANKIIGVEINAGYLHALERKAEAWKDPRIEIRPGNFFKFDWPSLIYKLDGSILILGNFPWVTNAQQGAIGGKNLPKKSNFQHHNGLDAMTGKSNFDISEWMLIQMINRLQNRDACLAMLCKTAVSRKILNYIHREKLNLAACSTYRIDAKQYFGAAVEACLLVCKFDSGSQNYGCDVFGHLEDLNHQRIEYRNNILIRDITKFETVSNLYGESAEAKWRSGIKHDCSTVMEFRKLGARWVNGLGEVVELEDTYLFPLIKGADVAQNRTQTTERYVLVPQKRVGEPTESIKDVAPKTWQYLKSHTAYFERRKSKIYQHSPRFSIFGVGDYTFSAWKIAICGLHKNLSFRLVSQIEGKPAVFDDTVYFLSFDDAQIAQRTFKQLMSSDTHDFYSSLIFWDEKRPIKSSILNCLNLSALLHT